jgi:hypothetical protein
MRSQSNPDQAQQAVLIKATSPATLERHYTVVEIAAIWNLSKDAVRRLFQDEPGVLVLGDASPRRRKRPYKTLRIPQSVVERVHSRCSLVRY